MLATKCRFAVSDPRGEGLAPDRIVQACDASLRRLGVDVIDLYQVHAPDPDAPLEQTLEALHGLVRAGKVRALGASNFPAWLLAWAVATQDREGWSPFISLQPQYSLVERSIETEILPFCRAAGLTMIPGPLGAGFLSGKYRRGERPPADSRIADADETLEEAYDRRATERHFPVVDAAREIAESRQATVPQVALAWLLGTPGVTAPIIGPRTFDQLEDLLAADAIDLTDDERARLEVPAGPPPVYPQRFLLEQCGIGDVPSVQASAELRRGGGELVLPLGVPAELGRVAGHHAGGEQRRAVVRRAVAEAEVEVHRVLGGPRVHELVARHRRRAGVGPRECDQRLIESVATPAQMPTFSDENPDVWSSPVRAQATVETVLHSPTRTTCRPAGC